jgi:hypothetical protein
MSDNKFVLMRNPEEKEPGTDEQESQVGAYQVVEPRRWCEDPAARDVPRLLLLLAHCDVGGFDKVSLTGFETSGNEFNACVVADLTCGRELRAIGMT